MERVFLVGDGYSWFFFEEWPFFVGTVLAKKSKTVPTNNTTGMRIYYMSFFSLVRRVHGVVVDDP